jgi:hypothetical protein
MTAPLNESALTARPSAEIARLGSRSLIAGVIGLALMGVGFATGGSHAFWESYLIAYIFLMSITIGALGVLMVQYLSGGAWGLVSRRVLEAATRTLPLMAVLFIPIVIELPVIFHHWATPEAQATEAVQLKAAYLNPPFFIARAVIYFVIWGTLIFILNKWSQEQDRAEPAGPGPADRKFRLVSGPGIVVFILTVTFMSVDWVMSLDPHFYSTIFGVLMLGGQGLTTMAFTIVVLATLVKYQPMSQVMDADKFHDLGKLMFAFLMLWGYFNVSQLIIIWSANLPEEIPFYLERLHGPWYWVSVSLLIGQFALPFMLLLSRSLKRNPNAVRWVAIFILLMRVIDITWLIGPVFRTGSGLHWLDFACVLGLGGIWMFLFYRNLGGRALVPVRDPYLKEALVHGGH